MISTYNEDGTVDVINMAWGGVCAENMVALNIDEDYNFERSGLHPVKSSRVNTPIVQEFPLTVDCKVVEG